jgi:PKD repeat protein
LLTLTVAVVLAGCSRDGGSALEADFSSRFEQPSTGPTSCPVIDIHFQDRTTGDPTAWQWTFDDGSTSSDQNPTWETSAVAAEVTLTVTRGDEEDSVTKMIDTHEC